MLTASLCDTLDKGIIDREFKADDLCERDPLEDDEDVFCILFYHKYIKSKTSDLC